MANQPKQAKPKIVDYGRGAHIYAGELVSTFYDGAAITITLGNIEARIPHKDARPEGQPVISISGCVSLTPSAAHEVVRGLTQMLNALASDVARGAQGKAN